MWCGAWKMSKQDGNPLATMLLRQQKMAGSLSPFVLSPVVLLRVRTLGPNGMPRGTLFRNDPNRFTGVQPVVLKSVMAIGGHSVAPETIQRVLKLFRGN